LKSVLTDLPKPLAKVADRAFIFYLLDILIKAKFDHVIISVGYMASKVIDLVGDKYKTLKVYYVTEDEPLGTAGAIRNTAEHYSAEQYVVLNGESYCEFNFEEFLQWIPSRFSFAMVLTYVSDSSRYGSVEIDELGLVLAFNEKSIIAGPGYINAGVYMIPKSTIEQFIPDGKVSLEQEVLPKLVGNEMFAWKHGGKFIDIGTPESLEQAQFFLRG